MGLCGVLLRAVAPLGVLILALSMSACLRQATEPEGYGLGVREGSSPAEAAISSRSPSTEAFADQAGDVVYFKGNSAELSANAKAILRKQITWLNRNPDYRVTVEGHADEWGTLQHNLSLGAKRAVAVKDYLKSNGFRGSRIHTVSYGKERLVADCSALACRAQNRRAKTVISPPVIR